MTAHTCADCDELATQKFEKVLPIVDEARDIWGIRVATFLCDVHAAELARTTRDRWEVAPLSNPRRKKTIEEQMAWDL